MVERRPNRPIPEGEHKQNPRLPPPDPEQAPHGGGSNTPEFASQQPDIQERVEGKTLFSPVEQREKLGRHQQEYQRYYRETNKEKRQEQQRLYQRLHRETNKEYHRHYYEVNREKILERKRHAYQKRKEERRLQAEQQSTQVYPPPVKDPSPNR